MHRRLALVRRPSPRLADGIVTHVERSPSVDADLAVRQWEEYCAALERRGWDVREAPAIDDCPDGVFVEDQVVVFGDVAVLCRSGAPARRAEQAGLREVLEPVGYRCVSIERPGTLDGGDVLKWGTRCLGRDRWPLQRGGDRPAGAGAETCTDRLSRQGSWVPVTRTLHLKSAVTALPLGTVIGHEATVDDARRWPDFLAVPEPAGAHVVLLGGLSVLMSAAAPRTAHLLQSQGHDVTLVDISEFEKLEGCVTCLSVRLRG